MALREQGFPDAAIELLSPVIRTRSRAPKIRHRALLERAQAHLARNRRAVARKDLERILAEDSDYLGVRDALHAFDTDAQRRPSL